MFRKSLFLGLTLMLAVVLVSLVIRSRREEKKDSAATREIVRQSRPSPTREIAPRDLVIVESKMEMVGPGGKPVSGEQPAATTHHEIVARNDGPAEYNAIHLKITYLDRKGQVLGSKVHFVSKPVPPHQTVSLGDISIEGVPASAANCSIQVLSADIK